MVPTASEWLNTQTPQCGSASFDRRHEHLAVKKCLRHIYRQFLPLDFSIPLRWGGRSSPSGTEEEAEGLREGLLLMISCPVVVE